jgi:hypothetical protein
MKTTLEIPDFLFRRAKSVAAERGIPLRQFVTEEKLRTTSQEKPWMKHVGKLKHLHGERKQIERRVKEAFEQIDREIWRFPLCLCVSGVKPSKKEKANHVSMTGLYLCRQRPTLPHTFACSTIGPAGLNFRVRDGNGWIPRGKITDNLIAPTARSF